VETAAYGCEVLFDNDRAAMLQSIIEGSTGEPCPCKQGKACPLLTIAPAGFVGCLAVQAAEAA
jgi:hypothetical protein